MNKIILTLTAFVLALAMSSCINDGKYVVQDDVVLYTHWTFSFGTRADTLPGADPATFEQVKSWLGHDSQHVYYLDRLVPGVDVASLKVVRKPLFRDKNDYYYEDSPIHVADVESFKIIKWSFDSFWAKDSRYAYFDTTRLEVDLATFKVESESVAKDKSHVYYFGDLVPDADPATFKCINKSAYYRDKNHIWCGSDMLTDVDYETFEVDGLTDAHDKNGPFRFEKRVNPEDFSVVEDPEDSEAQEAAEEPEPRN